MTRGILISILLTLAAGCRPSPVPATPVPTPTATAMPSLTPDIGPATLRIDVSPQGAVVLIDGAEVASTPATLTLAAGTYSVAVRQAGFAPLEETLTLEPNGEAMIAGKLKDVRPPQIVVVLSTTPVRLGQPADIRIEAQDNSAVEMLELWLGDELLGQVNAGAYRFRWMPERSGVHLFMARAIDGAGNVAEQELSLTVGQDPTATPTPTPTPRATASPPAPSPTGAPPTTAEVTVPTLNVREGPGTSFRRIGKVGSGQSLSVLGRNGEASWLHICCVDGQQGWISTDHVAYSGVVEAVPTAAAIPTLPAGQPAQPALPPVVVEETTVSIPTYPYAAFLRGQVDDAHGGFPFQALDRGAYEASNPAPVPHEYRLVVLENDFLRLTLLPELGGRVYECIFKPTGSNQFYRNPVIKPTHWGPTTVEGANWWLAAGGLEWGLPVEEHGYAWSVPWTYRINRSADGSATVRLWESDEQRLRAQIEVTLEPGHADFSVRITLENPTAQPVSYQFWSNGMLAPGSSNSVSDALEFIFPATEMTVHSSGDPRLPGSGEPFSWPIYQGRDISRLSSWQEYLGFFERPSAQGDFIGVYDGAEDEGIVRVFPREVTRGAKGFAFGWGEAAIGADHWTDDGSSYVELHVGVSSTFAEWAELGGGKSLSWQETWFPVAGLGGIVYAGQGGAVNLRAEAEGLRVGVFPTRSLQGDLTIMLDDVRIHVAEDVRMSPELPWQQLLTLPADRSGRGRVELRLIDRRTGLPHLTMPPREVSLR
ncbi:MAG TPA: DUF5107 domain-containing protein [Anaerolineae bacterium]|nr:DUF5107 domain-containing protein [Anaerolineae bacterium]